MLDSFIEAFEALEKEYNSIDWGKSARGVRNASDDSLDDKVTPEKATNIERHIKGIRGIVDSMLESIRPLKEQ